MRVILPTNQLSGHAGAAHTGDPRSLGQIMCATLVERVTGLQHADQINVELQVVVDLATLTGANTSEPAHLRGYGPIHPDLVHEILNNAQHQWLRRLITDPVTGSLVARDPHRRHFDSPTNKLLHARDEILPTTLL